jgi:hypothetical protein
MSSPSQNLNVASAVGCNLTDRRLRHRIGSVDLNFSGHFFMHVFQFLKTIFAEPTFQRGDHVNLVHAGTIDRTDGYVIAHTDKGVLVDWPGRGSSFMAPSELSVIG